MGFIFSKNFNAAFMGACSGKILKLIMSSGLKVVFIYSRIDNMVLRHNLKTGRFIIMCNPNTAKFMAMVMMLIMTLGAAASVTAASPKGERVRLMGTVTVIDMKGENFTIADRNKNTTKVFVNPSTEFEITVDRDNLSEDEARFSNLRVGDWVRIKSYRVNKELEASEVDVYRAP